MRVAGRDKRLARLWVGLTPWGEPRQIGGVRPLPVTAVSIADAVATWVDGLAELLQVEREMLLPNKGVLEPCDDGCVPAPGAGCFF